MFGGAVMTDNSSSGADGSGSQAAGSNESGGSGPGCSSGTLSSAEREAWEALVAGGWHVLAAISQGLADAGLSQTSDWRVMEALSKHERLRISDLAAITQISLSTVSRQITRMVETGRVERLDVECDARQRWVRLTASGADYVQEVAQIRDKLVRRHILDVITAEEFEVIGTAFGKIKDALLGGDQGR